MVKVQVEQQQWYHAAQKVEIQIFAMMMVWSNGSSSSDELTNSTQIQEK